MDVNETSLMTDRQLEQFRLGCVFRNGGFPRAAPHDESEWRYWLKGWDWTQAVHELLGEHTQHAK